jgi:hypothetical protein
MTWRGAYSEFVEPSSKERRWQGSKLRIPNIVGFREGEGRIKICRES